jgi:hypothetical protein
LRALFSHLRPSMPSLARASPGVLRPPRRDGRTIPPTAGPSASPRNTRRTRAFSPRSSSTSSSSRRRRGSTFPRASCTPTSRAWRSRSWPTRTTSCAEA